LKWAGFSVVVGNDYNDKTPLEIAQSNRHKKIIDILTKASVVPIESCKVISTTLVPPSTTPVPYPTAPKSIIPTQDTLLTQQFSELQQKYHLIQVKYNELDQEHKEQKINLLSVIDDQSKEIVMLQNSQKALKEIIAQQNTINGITSPFRNSPLTEVMKREICIMITFNGTNRVVTLNRDELHIWISLNLHISSEYEIQKFHNQFQELAIIENLEDIQDCDKLQIILRNSIADSRFPSNTIWKKHISNLFDISTVASGELFRSIHQQFEPLSQKGYQITRIEFIRNKTLMTRFNEKVNSLEFSRNDNLACNRTIPGINDNEKVPILNHFKQLFLPSPLRLSNIVTMWHGCSPEACQSICKGGAKDLRKTDGGYFGGGIYLTPDLNYAALYANNPNTEYNILLCQVVVGLTYPVSRATDYEENDPSKPWSISKFHSAYPIPEEAITRSLEGDGTELREALKKRYDKALLAGFDSHFICVSSNAGYQAVKLEDVEFFELVVKEEAQVLPFAVLYYDRS